MSKELSVWGKSHGLSEPYPLVAHLVDTASVAYAFLRGSLPSGVMRALGLESAEDNILRHVAFLAGMHDLGKATPSFQKQNEFKMNELHQEGLIFPAGKRVIHAHATQLTFPEASGGGEVNSPLSGALGASCMLGGHHGVFPLVSPHEIHQRHRSSLTTLNPSLGDEEWASVRKSLTRLVAEAATTNTAMSTLEGSQLVVGAGLVVISDWLASQDVFIRNPQEWPDWGDVDWREYFKERSDEAQEHIRASGLAPFVSRRLPFSETFTFQPRPLQASLEKHFERVTVGEGGILVVAAPMGVGKTEAALRAASAMGGDDSGILFLLPTMATANAMFGRVASYAESVSESPLVEVGLVHSMAGLHEQFLSLPPPEWEHISDGEGGDGAKAVASRWLKGRQRTLLAPVAAATIDQLLAATLKARRSYLRWLGLTGKVVIVDEAHSFDAYMNGLLGLALRWLGQFGVPVIIMSATMPTRIANELVGAWCEGAGIAPPKNRCPYPGWIHATKEKTTWEEVRTEPVKLEIRSIQIDDWEERWMTITQERLSSIEKEGCALVVCNTVAEAQKLTRQLTKWADQHGVDLRCLHSRFLNKDRSAITEDILDKFGKDGVSRPRKAVLVATQIVEQSLDVDFDLVISALAPVAPLLQRSGRGHRHARTRPDGLTVPTLEVLIPVNGKELAVPPGWRFVYPATYLERTWKLALEEGARTSLSLPEDVQPLVDAVYGNLDDYDFDSSDIEEPLLEQMDSEWIEKNANPASRIPAPDALRALSDLSADVDEELILATRLGLDSVPVLCVWRHQDTLTLDADGKIPLPENDMVDKNLVKKILGNVVNVRRTKTILEATRDSDTPATWKENPYLRDILVLEFEPANNSAAAATTLFTLSATLGLEQEKMA